MRGGYASGGRGITPRPSFAGNINYNGKRIWCYGDSITWGVGDGATQTAGCGYRDRLDLLLAAGGHVPQWVGSQTTGFNGITQCPYNNKAMANDGHSGFTCVQLQAAQATYFAATGIVDVVLMHAGTNDLIADQANSTSLANGNFTAFFRVNSGTCSPRRFSSSRSSSRRSSSRPVRPASTPTWLRRWPLLSLRADGHTWSTCSTLSFRPRASTSPATFTPSRA